jgi:preprotein translocase subunit SecA
LIYKLESYGLFKTMVETMNRKSTSVLMRAQIPLREPEAVRQAAPERRQDYSKYRTEKDGPAQGSGPAPAPNGPVQRNHEPIHAEQKVGRNDPCPCGSGKKFKQCHGKDL